MCLWFVHDLSMICLWFVYGLSMVVCQWFVRGLSMVCPWFVHGLSMVWPWFSHGILCSLCESPMMSFFLHPSVHVLLKWPAYVTLIGQAPPHQYQGVWSQLGWAVECTNYELQLGWSWFFKIYPGHVKFGGLLQPTFNDGFVVTPGDFIPQKIPDAVQSGMLPVQRRFQRHLGASATIC